MVDSKELQSEIGRYELTSDQLLSFIGLTDIEAVRARLHDLSFPAPESSIKSDYLIPEWGITLDQFIDVVTILKPSPKLSEAFVSKIGTPVLIKLAGRDFIDGWRKNNFPVEKLRKLYINEIDILDAKRLIGLYKAVNSLVKPRSQI
ncbi:hypothetical protein KBC89_05380 [Candidatus Woesebacteria bacterium]|nr:hypothetical protein [Candidatus Woesebacteria bacterium]